MQSGNGQFPELRRCLDDACINDRLPRIYNTKNLVLYDETTHHDIFYTDTVTGSWNDGHAAIANEVTAALTHDVATQPPKLISLQKYQ